MRDFLSGESLAAAHVTGVVALLREQNPHLSAGEALQVLKSTAQATPRDLREPAARSASWTRARPGDGPMGVASCP